MQAPVSALEAEAERLITWLCYGMAAANSSSSVSAGSGSSGTSSYPAGTGTGSSGTGSGGGASFLATSWVSMNPDFQQVGFILDFFAQIRASSTWDQMSCYSASVIIFIEWSLLQSFTPDISIYLSVFPEFL